jgi:hypothetical protein
MWQSEKYFGREKRKSGLVFTVALLWLSLPVSPQDLFLPAVVLSVLTAAGET